MYKFVLCWRYLRTRYIALASIVSVTLGVATMIVVNSVMAGFNREMQERIHGILSDLVFESHSMGGFHDPEWHMAAIRRIAGDTIEAMTPTVVVPAMLSFQVHGQSITRQVNLIGIDDSSHSGVSDFGRFLQHPANRELLKFSLRERGYDVRDHQGGADAMSRPQMEHAGWDHRRRQAERQRILDAARRLPPGAPTPSDDPFRIPTRVPGSSDADAQTPSEQAAESTSEPPAQEGGDAGAIVADPFREQQPAEDVFDPAREQHTGAVMGIALASFRGQDGQDRFLLLPGDDVQITVPTAGTPPKAVSDSFTVVDLYESKMSEYDSSFMFVPLSKLQQMRGMIDPTSGIGSVTSIQIKLRPGADGDAVCRKLQVAFPEIYGIQTWREKQGALLAAVSMETAILNVLLFMIIAVAGFGILAIFFMIVVEKTRDIGILKSLGASGRGIQGIFLAYGLSLGIVGSGAGMVLGLLFVVYINEIAKYLGKLTGREVFDPAIYYFQKIPTIVDPYTVSWIVCGAMLIAVIASILPARRAARLHPVEALRYE